MKYFIIIIFSGFFIVFSSSAQEWKTEPKLNNGKKWQVGYYEGGDYFSYKNTFIAIIKELMKMGWIEEAQLPDFHGNQTKTIWQWLSNESRSKYIQFVKDAHYSAGWNKSLKSKLSETIIERMNKKKDIDLIFAMGTWAGKALANNKHKTFIMILSCSDPVYAGIVKNFYESGYDHVHAYADPFRFERQIKAFYKVINFNKLGIAYQDTLEGRSYAGLESVKKLAKQYGFEIIHCNTNSNGSLKINQQKIKNCFKQLVKKVDAIYVTMQFGINKNTVPELAKIANENCIPTFSQRGTEEVKQGFLMTIELSNLKYMGKFYAETLAKIFNGTQPGKLPMYIEHIYKWNFNFETASKIGLDLSSINLEDDYLYNLDF